MTDEELAERERGANAVVNASPARVTMTEKLMAEHILQLVEEVRRLRNARFAYEERWNGASLRYEAPTAEGLQSLIEAQKPGNVTSPHATSSVFTCGLAGDPDGFVDPPAHVVEAK